MRIINVAVVEERVNQYGGKYIEADLADEDAVKMRGTIEEIVQTCIKNNIYIENYDQVIREVFRIL